MSRLSILNLNIDRKTATGAAVPGLRALMWLVLCAVGLLVSATDVHAGKIPEIYGRVFKTYGEFDPVRIGIAEFSVADDGGTGYQADLIAAEIAQVVYDDLDFAYLFESLRPDTTYLRIMGMSEIDLRGWRHLGAEYLIEGEIEVEESELAVSYTLNDLVNGRQVFKRRLKSRRDNIRLLAHVLSDEVYEEIANRPGIFQTRIAYLHGSGNYKEVHVCDYDGANDYAVTADRTVVVTPRWAGPNTLSYTSYLDGNPDVWMLDLSRDRATKFSSQPGLNSSCTWSADGRKYVLSLSVDGNPEIYIGDRNSQRPRRLTFSPGIDTSPTFSPDGKRIIFTSDRAGTPQLYIMDDDGANVQRITYTGNYNESPNWSPTMDLIVYVTRIDGLFQIMTARPDGSEPRQLTEVGSNENPHWSPDGLHIVFSSNRSGTYEIYTMNYDKSEVPRRVTTTGNNSNPSWSP